MSTGKLFGIMMLVVLLVLTASPAFAAAPEPPRTGQPEAAEIVGAPTTTRTGSENGNGEQVQAGPNGPAYRPTQGGTEEAPTTNAAEQEPEQEPEQHIEGGELRKK